MLHWRSGNRSVTVPEDEPQQSTRTCPVVVGYQAEPPGSDVADPRIRCGKPATVQVAPDLWMCGEHAGGARGADA